MKSISVFLLLLLALSSSRSSAQILTTDKLQKNVAYFNSIDTENIKNYVPNSESFDWLSKNIPLFDCPDSVIQTLYDYRWWAFRKHLKQTPDGFIFTEFITLVKHAGSYNSVSSATGHHIYEGRWLRDPKYIKDYISFWLYVDKKRNAPKLHGFSGWVEDAVYKFYLVNQDAAFAKRLLPTLDSNYRLWEQEKGLPNGMFWQYDVKDAMEESISGGRKQQNVRPTINSYMYGNAKALASLATLAGNDTLKSRYAKKAAFLKTEVQKQLWNDSQAFFEVKYPDGKFANVREELGLIPWYFNLPDDKKKYAAAWNQLTDTTGFNAPWGITTAERRHPGFRTHGTGHGCEWDGAVWPFATTQTLKALSNLLTDYSNHAGMTPQVFYNELHKYAASHQMEGKLYLGEYQDEKTGRWLKGPDPRSEFYNHSGYADLIISDLIGLKSRADNKIEINPLLPKGQWAWFCLDKVRYHNHDLTILWDENGSKYGKGKGFVIFADGKEIYRAAQLKHAVITLK